MLTCGCQCRFGTCWARRPNRAVCWDAVCCALTPRVWRGAWTVSHVYVCAARTVMVCASHKNARVSRICASHLGWGQPFRLQWFAPAVRRVLCHCCGATICSPKPWGEGTEFPRRDSFFRPGQGRARRGCVIMVVNCGDIRPGAVRHWARTHAVCLRGLAYWHYSSRWKPRVRYSGAPKPRQIPDRVF